MVGMRKKHANRRALSGHRPVTHLVGKTIAQSYDSRASVNNQDMPSMTYFQAGCIATEVGTCDQRLRVSSAYPPEACSKSRPLVLSGDAPIIGECIFAQDPNLLHPTPYSSM